MRREDVADQAFGETVEPYRFVSAYVGTRKRPQKKATARRDHQKSAVCPCGLLSNQPKNQKCDPNSARTIPKNACLKTVRESCFRDGH